MSDFLFPSSLAHLQPSVLVTASDVTTPYISYRAKSGSYAKHQADRQSGSMRMDREMLHVRLHVHVCMYAWSDLAGSAGQGDRENV